MAGGNAAASVSSTSNRERNFAVRLSGLLVAAYIFGMLFTFSWDVPMFGHRLQPAEVIFLPLFLLAVLFWRNGRLPDRMWWWPLGIYVAANGASALSSAAGSSGLEVIGRGYLVLVFTIIAAYVRQPGVGKKLKVEKVWIAASLTMAAVSVSAYVLAMAGVSSGLVPVFEAYPYLGTTLRLQGLTSSPNMLLLVLCPALFITGCRLVRGQGDVLSFVLLLTAALLTFSKELILVGAGLFLCLPGRAILQRPLLQWGILGIAAVIFWSATHVILIRGPSVEGTYLEGTVFTGSRLLFRLEGFSLVESNYLAMKRANWAIGMSHFWTGVGPGQVNEHLRDLQEMGLYPAHLPHYDPHSSWFGAFSETGILGLMALMGLLLVMARHIRAARLLQSPDVLARSLSTYLLVLLIDSLCMDVMNFRPLWVAMGVLAGFPPSPPQKGQDLSEGRVNQARRVPPSGGTSASSAPRLFKIQAV